MAVKILIVDDEPYVLRVGGRVLRNAGYDVQVSVNGEAALELAASDPPDLIILDVMLPGMDGYAVCRQLKSDPATAASTVVFLTARDESSDLRRALKAGAKTVLYKPFSPTKLLEYVREILDSEAGQLLAPEGASLKGGSAPEGAG